MCPLESLDRGPLSMGDLSMTIGHVCFTKRKFQVVAHANGADGADGAVGFLRLVKVSTRLDGLAPCSAHETDKA